MTVEPEQRPAWSDRDYEVAIERVRYSPPSAASVAFLAELAVDLLAERQATRARIATILGHLDSLDQLLGLLPAGAPPRRLFLVEPPA